MFGVLSDGGVKTESPFHHLIWRVQGYNIRLPGRVAIARYG